MIRIHTSNTVTAILDVSLVGFHLGKMGISDISRNPGMHDIFDLFPSNRVTRNIVSNVQVCEIESFALNQVLNYEPEG